MTTAKQWPNSIAHIAKDNWNEYCRLGNDMLAQEEKYASGLTEFQIADSFSDEARKYLPAKIAVLEAKLIKRMAEMRRIELSNTSAGQQMWDILAWEMNHPQEKALIDELDSYKKIMRYVTLKTRGDWVADEVKIAKAKEYPIKDAFSFKSQSIARGRIKAICPFHNEKTPSFVIYLNNNSFHCFGCQVGGDSIDFMMKLKKCTFKQAVEVLQ